MKILLNNNEIELNEFRFTNNFIVSNTGTGGYGYCYYSLYEESGTLLDVTELYRDIFNAHKGESGDYQSEWHNVCVCTAKGQFDEEEHTYYIRERYIHESGRVDRIVIQYQCNLTGDTFYLPVYYPKLWNTNNLLACGFIGCENMPDNSYIATAFICNPSYINIAGFPSQYQGGFEYAYWNSEGRYPGIVPIQCDFSDLSRYPTPDENIPLTQSFRANRIVATASISSTNQLIVNGEVMQPKTPDNDENTPSTKYGPYKDISDPIDFSSIPANGPLDTGFIKAYVLTNTQSQQIAEFMLTDHFLTNFKKLYLQPIDYIVSLHFLPVTPTASTPISIKIGGVDSEVIAPPTRDNYVTFRSGSINLEEFWGSFLDYAPATHVLIYIPFVGIRELNTDDVMTGKLELQYNVNVLDGDFICELKSDSTHKLNGVIETYQGNMRMTTPVSSMDYTNKIMAGINAAAQGTMALAGAAAGGGVSMGAVGSTAVSALQATLMKPTFSRSGNVSGGAGMLGNFTPYLIKVRPKQAVPKLYTKLFGKPSLIGGTVSIFNGYTEFKRIDLSGIGCSDTERKEIENLMKEGVFV